MWAKAGQRVFSGSMPKVLCSRPPVVLFPVMTVGAENGRGQTVVTMWYQADDILVIPRIW